MSFLEISRPNYSLFSTAEVAVRGLCTVALVQYCVLFESDG